MNFNRIRFNAWIKTKLSSFDFHYVDYQTQLFIDFIRLFIARRLMFRTPNKCLIALTRRYKSNNLHHYLSFIKTLS